MSKRVEFKVFVEVDEGFDTLDLISHVFTGIKQHLATMVPANTLKVQVIDMRKEEIIRDSACRRPYRL